ncbi:UDP-N-acetylglucosamine transferase subunit ALG13-like isoform X2 [Ptychodera flava]|uniref:UDP-N-acetylglucosamine transferase subunit ALG13-like isoform X2 n=1 Tax=Ptychodera flava TaxID=63121 RepID=UPI00396A81AC
MYKGRKTKGDPMDDYLSMLGLFRKPTAKDGSCLFRAVSEQVFKCQALHLQVREACIRFMERHRERFEPFVEGPFDHHLFALRNPKEWAGQVEISAMSIMFKRDFQVYQEVGKPPDKVTQNGFNEIVLLCFTGGSHYDSVFPKPYQEVAAICQSIVYSILYINVFDMEKEVNEAIDLLRSKSKRKQSESSTDSGEVKHDSELETSTESEKSKEGENKENEAESRRYEASQRKPAFPYKVAKALDPEIYRNVELDIWMDARKEQQRHDYHYAANLQFSPGDKCLAHLNDEARYFNAHIQIVHSPQGPVTVFIEDLGEKHTLPIKNLKPLMQYPSHSQQWITMTGGGKGYKSLTGYHQKPVNGYFQDMHDPKKNKRINKRNKYIPGGAFIHGPNAFMPPFQHAAMAATFDHQQTMARGNAMQQHHQHQQLSAQQYNPSSQQQLGERSARPLQRFSPSKTAPRFNRMNQENMADTGGLGSPGKPSPEYQPQHSRQPWAERPTPAGRGRGRYSGRGSPKTYFGHTPEEREERKAIEESVALYEIQKRDATAFPALPVAQHSPAPAPGGPVSFWNKYNRETRSPTPPINIPSPGSHDERQAQTLIQENEFNEQMQELSVADQSFPADDGFETTHVRKMSSPNSPCIQRPMDDHPQQLPTQHQQAPPPPHHPPQPQVQQQQQHQQQPPPPPQQLQLQQQSPYSSSPVSGGSMTQMSASPVPPTPVMVANNYIPFGMPMYPMYIPITENLAGPVNYATPPSRDVYGSDLPHSDVNTMRFFFNIGVEYYHRYMSLVQMQQQQQQQQQQQAQQEAIVYNIPMGPPPPQPQPQPQPQAQPQPVIATSQSQGSPGNSEMPYGMYIQEDERYVSDGTSSQDDPDECYDQQQQGNALSLNQASTEFVDPSIIHQVPAQPGGTFQPIVSEKSNTGTSSFAFGQKPAVTHEQPVMLSEPPPPPPQSSGRSHPDYSQPKQGLRQRKFSGGSNRFKSPPRFRNIRNALGQSQHGQNEMPPATSQQQYPVSSTLHGSSQSLPSHITGSSRHSLHVPSHRSPHSMNMPPHTQNIPPRLMHTATTGMVVSNPVFPANTLQSLPSHTGPSMPYYADSSSSNSQSSAPATSSFSSPASNQASTASEHYTQPAVTYDNQATASYQFTPQGPQNAGLWAQANASSAYMYPSSQP